MEDSVQTIYQQQAKKKLVTTILAIVIIAGVVLYADHLKAQNTSAASKLAVSTSSTTPSSSASTSSTSGTAAQSSSSGPTASGSKDGSFSAVSDYFVPHGDEAIKVNVTLSGGVVTAASVQNSETNPTSAQFQDDFASTFKSFVVGKKISGLQLDVIAGASDTTQGFNDALSKIASQVQA